MIETIIPRAPQGGDSGGGSFLYPSGNPYLSGNANSKQAGYGFDSLPFTAQLAAALVIGVCVYFGPALIYGVMMAILGVD